MNRSKVAEFGLVSEMADTASALEIEVPIAPGVDLAALTDGDESPMFVTLDALSEGISTNKRRYTLAHLNAVAAQVMKNTPDAYQGHLTDAERDHVYPDAVTIWIGAKVEFYKGKNRLFIKGYVLPAEPKFRDRLKRALASGRKIAVSIWGDALQKWNATVGAYDLFELKVDSIDWARPGSEGVPPSGYAVLTAEMSKGDLDMDRQEVLQSTSLSEMKSINPSLVTEIEEAAAAPIRGTISEMASVLGIEEDKVVSTVTEMAADNKALRKADADAFLDGKVAEVTPSVAARTALKRLLVSEMGTDYSRTDLEAKLPAFLESEEAKTLVQEMSPHVIAGGGGQNNREINPGGSRFIKK